MEGRRIVCACFHDFPLVLKVSAALFQTACCMFSAQRYGLYGITSSSNDNFLFDFVWFLFLSRAGNLLSLEGLHVVNRTQR
jgi:hypothetical protein